MYKLLFVGDDAHIVLLEVLGTPSAADRTTKGRMWASRNTGGVPQTPCPPFLEPHKRLSKRGKGGA